MVDIDFVKFKFDMLKFFIVCYRFILKNLLTTPTSISSHTYIFSKFHFCPFHLTQSVKTKIKN